MKYSHGSNILRSACRLVLGDFATIVLLSLPLVVAVAAAVVCITLCSYLCEKDRNFTLLVRLFCLPLLFTTLSKAELLAAEVKQTKTKTKNKKKRDEHIACFPSRSFNYCDCGNTT